MLNGIEPIIIFQFSKAFPSVSEELAKIPLVSEIPTLVESPPIPIYLSENLTGLFIDTEAKNIDAETNTGTKTDGSTPDVNQKGISSVVSIDINANKNSLGLQLLTAMADLVFEKLTSKEYHITYLHGPTTVFRGVLQSFSVNQNANDDLLRIKIELNKGGIKTPTKVNDIPTNTKNPGTVDTNGNPIPIPSGNA